VQETCAAASTKRKKAPDWLHLAASTAGVAAAALQACALAQPPLLRVFSVNGGWRPFFWRYFVALSLLRANKRGSSTQELPCSGRADLSSYVEACDLRRLLHIFSARSTLYNQQISRPCLVQLNRTPLDGMHEQVGGNGHECIADCAEKRPDFLLVKLSITR
jgi:hypothetical protein